MISYGDVEEFHPVRIVMHDDVRQLMQSNEAKTYLKQIERAGERLQKFIRENRSGSRCQKASSGAA